ncbi:MAG: amidohydrolase [Eggerthellaceae bacterium]|nr:amidohydrolase [Eggerthellaceae bacterium]
MSTVETILQAVKEDHAYVVGLRRHFHQHPELSRHEDATNERIIEELTSLGLEVHRIPEHSLYTDITGELPGKAAIVLRADIDALPVQEADDRPYASQVPGVMHACGHDAHIAGLIGAARILVRNRNLFGGTVRLVFQEGEEVGYGGHKVVESGALDIASRTFGIHMASNVPVGSVVITPGPNNASVDYFNIAISGKGAHVSTPEAGIDALYIASQIVVASQALVTRRLNPTNSVLIGIGKLTAGTAYNVVAESAVIEGTIRALTPETREQVKRELEELACRTARIYGGTASIRFEDYTSPLINDETSSHEAQSTAAALFGEEKVITNRPASLQGDDMAELINCVPGAYAFVGSANAERPNTQVSHHNKSFDIDEDALTVSTALYAQYAIDYLQTCAGA